MRYIVSEEEEGSSFQLTADLLAVMGFNIDDQEQRVYHSKARKCLVKVFAAVENTPESNHGFTNDYEDPRRSSPDGRKRRMSGHDYGKKEKLDKREQTREQDGIVEEMWQTIVDDHDHDHDCNNPPPQVRNSPNILEEDGEIEELFKVGRMRKKKKPEKTDEEISMLIEKVMAELELAAEEDADLNRQSKPAINKLRKLPFLQQMLSKKHLQHNFLDHGVLTLFKTWLEPLPDGSLPNITVREAILKLLHDFPIDLEHFDRREQFKKSGLGKVVMFFSKTDEETAPNRRLAKELVDKWCRPIFNNSIRYEEDEIRVPMVRPLAKLKRPSGLMQSRDDDDLELAEVEVQQGKSFSCRCATKRPEAMSMDFVVRPRSKIDPDAIISARAKQVQDQSRLRIQKRLRGLKAPKRKQMQATKLSAEGRGMIKFL